MENKKDFLKFREELIKDLRFNLYSDRGNITEKQRLEDSLYLLQLKINKYLEERK